MNTIKLVSLICAATLATACVTKQTYDTEVQKANTYAALSQKLQGELNKDQAQITQLQNELKVTMVNEVLFPEGGWALSSKGEETLARIAPTLSNLSGQQLVVQGFTDSEPIGPALKSRFPSNLELSSARADNVARYLVSKGVPQNSISAQGFGDARPVASNETPQGKAKNRRVEIVISAAGRP